MNCQKLEIQGLIVRKKIISTKLSNSKNSEGIYINKRKKNVETETMPSGRSFHTLFHINRVLISIKKYVPNPTSSGLKVINKAGKKIHDLICVFKNFP